MKKYEKVTLHKRLVSAVKYNKFFLSIYHVFGKIFIFILKLFTRVNDKQILFLSFGGQKYDDSPKALYNAILEDPYFNDYTLIWGFTDPHKYDEVACSKVRVDSFKFFKTALTSAVWIHNSSMTRGLNFSRNGILEINTWHGTPLKKIGNDANSQAKCKKYNSKNRILYCAQSEYDQEIFSRLFRTDKTNIIISDLPRNDSLLEYTNDTIANIKKNLGISDTKKIILYAPTFREYDRNSSNACYINPPININKWRQELGDKYIILFRAHHEIIDIMGIADDDFMKNVSDYPCLNDLMVISDLLISDYSSIYFDFSILEKPMFNFSYDYETYCAKRGLYLNLNDVLPCNINFTENTLINEILNFNMSEYCARTIKFKNFFCPYAGKATEILLSKLKQQLKL